jgi:Protein of unknown function (DUF3618)
MSPQRGRFTQVVYGLDEQETGHLSGCADGPGSRHDHLNRSTTEETPMTTNQNPYTLSGTTAVTTEPDALRAEIERTRADLGDTVTALSDKVDPRVRVRRAATTAKTTVTAGAAHLRTVAPQRARQAQQAVRRNPVPAAAGVVAVAAALALIIGRGRAAKAARNRRRPGFLQR